MEVMMEKKNVLGTHLTNTYMRTPTDLSSSSGMCSVCTLNCTGPCEIGLSATRGSEAIYPYKTDLNQFGSQKRYALDYSDYNINGRVFGAFGYDEDSFNANYTTVNFESHFGKVHKVNLKAPIILPAIAKLNWEDYFSGAAIAGVLVVIGEDVISKDKDLVLVDGKVMDSPFLKKMVESFKKYYRGYGDIILQANVDDDLFGVLDYAIKELGVESVEFKFGQAAKGIQGTSRIRDIEQARNFKKMGYYVYPDPFDNEIIDRYERGNGPVFEKIGRLPMWSEEYLEERIKSLRNLGVKRICFKTGPYDVMDLVKIIKIGIHEKIDLITFDGAGGGTGNSPIKMMNEWGIPTAQLENILFKILKSFDEKGFDLPQVAITGGIAMEDQVFKALALGSPYISLVGIGRAAMAAAMSGKEIGDRINSGKTPKEYERFGNTIESVFDELKSVRHIYKDSTLEFSTGSIGLYSYLQRITTGTSQLMALNRRFSLSSIRRDDVVPMTELAKCSSDLLTYDERIKF
jgi:hypothetical protein